MNTESIFPPPLKAEPGHKELMLRVMAMPADSNPGGAIFGGWLMSHMDIAGALLAGRAAGNARIVTVAVNSLVFKQPVAVGDLLSFYAEVIKIGTTSVTIEVSAYAWNKTNFDREPAKVSEATITYVSIGEDGEPCPIAAH